MNRVREAMERGRDHERRRVLRLVDELTWVASISRNGEVTENALYGLKDAIEGRATR